MSTAPELNQAALAAAHDAYDASHECQPREHGQALQEAILAYLAALSAPEAPAVGVKVLEWKDVWDGAAYAPSAVGTYSCPKFHTEWDLLHDGRHMHPKVHGLIKAYPTLEAAKAAAQADFETRVHSTLVATPPAPVDGNALLREIERLRPHYQSFTGTDRARRQILDHFEQFAAAISRAKAGPVEPVEVGYTNWRGEYAVRKIIPRTVWFGSTEWHPEPQWLIKAHDVEKDAERDFALTGFTSPRPDAGVIASPVQGMEDRKTFVVPDGFEAVFDDEGRATGQVRPRATALAPALAEPQGVDIPRLPVGTAVVKAGGYPFHGEVRAAFTTIASNERFVVEATGADYRGMLHIFNGGQLAAAPEQEPQVESRAIGDIAAERQRQIDAEGWTPEHDDEHSGGELTRAAACYALGKSKVTNINGDITNIWPWEDYWFKATDRRRNLVKAGALIAAEIERLDRAAAPEQEKSNG